jgi:hypothetical protein
MVEFVGGRLVPEATPPEYLAILRELLVQYRDDAPESILTSARRYLEPVEDAL